MRRHVAWAGLSAGLLVCVLAASCTATEDDSAGSGGQDDGGSNDGGSNDGGSTDGGAGDGGGDGGAGDGGAGDGGAGDGGQSIPDGPCEATAAWFEDGDAPAQPSDGWQDSGLTAGCVVVVGTLDPDEESGNANKGDNYFVQLGSTGTVTITLQSTAGSAANSLQAQLLDSSGFSLVGSAQLPDQASVSLPVMEDGLFTLWVVHGAALTQPLPYDVFLDVQPE